MDKQHVNEDVMRGELAAAGRGQNDSGLRLREQDSARWRCQGKLEEMCSQ